MTSDQAIRNQATRLKLKSRLDLARDAGELLRSKEVALMREQTRLGGHVDRSESRWRQRCREATTWLLRARALGAGAEITEHTTAGAGTATLTARWQNSMGVDYPGAVECIPGPRPTMTATAALPPTIDAYRDALAAGAEHAAITAAQQRIDAELARTRRRRRAIEEHLTPLLEAELRAVDLHLDELDREESLRARIASEAGVRSR